MLIDDAFAARLVCNAATLDERLSSQLDFITDSSGMSVKQARLDRWRSLLGADDDLFQDIRGVEVNNALQNRLGHLNVLPDQNFPSWVQTLRAALKGIQQPSATNLKGGQQTLPFSQVLQHFVAEATRTVITRSTTEMLAISPQAFADFQQMLLFKLCEVIAPCLHDHFARYRMINNPLLVLRSDFHQAIVGNELYNLYVIHLESGGLIQFFEEYPVAARAIAILMECWIESVLEFLERLYQDLPFLRLTFGFLEAERVTSIQTGLSDPHNGGRSVFILTFDRGRRIVYKPRSITPEVHFGTLLDRLKQLEFPTISIAPKALDRGNYGWVEFIERCDCTTKEEVAIYFENLGAMLALLYSLGTSDIHHENIVAHGSYPVVVDLETLLCPRPKAVDGNHDKGWDSFYTVQRVGLLSNEYTSKGRDFSVDVSALGSKQELVLKTCFGEWQNINCDNMYLGEPKCVKVKRDSLPSLNGENFHCQDYSAEFISGFSSAYTALLKAKEFILNNENFLLPHSSSPIRFVLRHTELYSNLLDSSLHPTWMTEGVDRSIELEILYQTLVENQRFDLRKIIQAEKNSLESLDIPYFWCTAGGTDLRTSQEIVGNGFFAKSGIQIARELIARLNEKHLEQQISIIRASLFVSQIREAHPSSFLDADCAPGTILARPELIDNFLVETAHQVATRICELALPQSAPNWKWIAPELIASNGRYSVRPLGPRLYDGNGGIALFFSALAKISGEDTYRQIALELLEPIRELLLSPALPRWIEEHGLGITTGFGSLIYSLVTAGCLLSEKNLVTDALSSVLLADVLHRNSNPLLDLSHGCAGGILALLVLYRETGEMQVLQQATQYGEELLLSMDATEDYSAAWKQRGIAHGVDGLYLALRRLSHLSGDLRFAEVARLAQKCADTPSQDEHHQSGLRMSWCWGVPGICLSDLASGDGITGNSNLEQDLQAIATIAQSGSDYLCCGSLGRIEVLLYGGQLLGRPKLREIATELTLSVARRAKYQGAFQTLPIPHPGFFQGLAGIGYQLLRVQFPQQLPSILAFD